MVFRLKSVLDWIVLIGSVFGSIGLCWDRFSDKIDDIWWTPIMIASIFGSGIVYGSVRFGLSIGWIVFDLIG